MDPLESLRVQKVIIQDGSIQIHKTCGKKQDAFYPYSSISVKLLYRVACFFWCWLKSVHIKKTVARSSFLSKLGYFSIQHQLTSKQSQLMLYWKVPQFWKKLESRFSGMYLVRVLKELSDLVEPEHQLIQIHNAKNLVECGIVQEFKNSDQ